MQGFEWIFLVLLALLMGVLIGYAYRDTRKPATDGKLKYFNDPDDGLYFFLEFPDENGPSKVLHKKHAIFEVDTSEIISHD